MIPVVGQDGVTILMDLTQAQVTYYGWPFFWFNTFLSFQIKDFGNFYNSYINIPFIFIYKFCLKEIQIQPPEEPRE